MCKYRKDNELPDPKAQKKMNASMRKTCEKYEDKHIREYIDEMRKIEKKLMNVDVNEDDEPIQKKVDDNYYVKFGHLKKAAVLKFYGRNNDAYDAIIKAAKIVKNQRELNKERDEAIQRRWKFKLGIEAFEPPFPLDKYHPEDPRMEKELRAKQADLGAPLATVKLYIEKVSPYNLDAFSKNVYLDRCIEEMMLECEKERMDKKHQADTMKTQIEKLEALQELADTFGEDGLEGEVDENGDPIKFKARKTQMCESVIPKADPEDAGRIFRHKPKGVWKYNREEECKYLIPPYLCYCRVRMDTTG